MEFLSENKIPDFAKMPDGLLPAIVQDVHTRQVLMLGYMNAAALEATQVTGLATFYSRSRQQLWVKGETSGNTLRVHNVLLDCDQDAILVKVTPAGPVCHTGDDTCWQEKNESASFLPELQQLIDVRKNTDPEASYTARLFAAGIAKIAQKVGEEAVETVIEGMGDNTDRLHNESADLLFHLLVLLSAKGTNLQAVEAVLRQRNTKR
jgi:phosphoribosyl-AMP cyclohydrolase / phosphoribosyl-ATP pyrophosphohydrolase